MIDRLPPQSVEAEQSVLGSILIDRDAVIEVAEFLKPDDFYRQAHAKIYAVILDLFERREPIDIVTVAEALERDEDLEAIGVGNVLFETDYPHPVCLYGNVREKIVAGLGSRPEEQAAMALWDNAASLYGVERPATPWPGADGALAP